MAQVGLGANLFLGIERGLWTDLGNLARASKTIQQSRDVSSLRVVQSKVLRQGKVHEALANFQITPVSIGQANHLVD